MKLLTGPLTLCLCLAALSTASAQATDPASSDIVTGVDRIVETPRIDNPEEAALSSVRIEYPTQQPPVNSATLRFTLADVEIDGPEILPAEDLRALYAESIGQEITLLQAFEILSRIQAAHRDAGYVFTRVIAPPQEIDSGIFTLQVVEAFIGKVVIEEPDGPVGPPLPLVERLAAQLAGVKNPTLGELERTLLLINDIPGITQATAVPRPGDGLGAVDLYINVARDPFSGVFFADNRQSPVLGPGIVGVSLEASSWSSAGDTTTLSFFNTIGDRFPDDLTERNIVQLEHQRHIGSNGTTIKARALASRNSPGDLLEDSDIDGEQFNGELTVEHPVIRTRALSLWASAGFEIEENTVESLGGATRIVDDSLRVAYVGARLLQRDDYGYTSASAQLRHGLDILGASDTGEPSLSRFDGNAEFIVLNGQIEREVKLPVADEGFSVLGAALGQVSSRSLLSSEEFAVGGQQIARAYDPSEFTGDSGYGILGELRYQLDFEVQGQPIAAQFYGYGDLARVFNRGNTEPSQSLQSYGGGVRLSLPYQVSLSGEVAVPMQPLRRNGSENPRFFFNFAKRF